MINRIQKLQDDAAEVFWAYPVRREGLRVDGSEVRAVLAIFGAKTVADISESDEPAFRRYLQSRLKSFGFPA